MGKCESCYHKEMAKNYRWYVTSPHLHTSFYLVNYSFLLIHPGTLLILQTVPIAVDITMLKMMKVVAWSVATHDGNIDRTKQLEQRDPEGEPCRAMMDPWARGTVPTKKEVIDPFMNLSGSNSGPPSIASRQPSRAPSDAVHINRVNVVRWVLRIILKGEYLDGPKKMTIHLVSYVFYRKAVSAL